jgi:iron(III) transport system permease protein
LRLVRWLLIVACVLATAWPLAFSAERTWGLARCTVLLTAATVAISVPVGTLLAWLLVRTDLPGRRLALMLLGLMLFVPLYLQAGAWQAGFGLQGWLPLALEGPVLLDGFAGAVWIHAMAAVPWVVLIAGAGFRMIDPELEELALLDATAGQVFFRVSLPAAGTALATATLWVAILTAGEMTVTDLFAVRTYAEELYTRIADDPPLAAAPGVVLAAWLILAGLAVAVRWRPRRQPFGLQRPWTFSLGIWKVPLAMLVAALLLVLLGVPLGNLLYKAGVIVQQTDVGRIRAWSGGKCLAIVAGSPIRYARELGWSLWIAGLAATGAILAGLPLAVLARRGRWWSRRVLALAAAGLALPGPMIGLGMIWLLSRPEIPGMVYLYNPSLLPLWLAMPVRGIAPALAILVRALPPATFLLWHALASFPQELLDAAALDGAGPWTRLRCVVLPNRWPAVALAWLVALVVSLGDLSASILVAPPGVTTLSVRIFSLLHYGIEDQVAGICLALVGLFAIVALTARRLHHLGELYYQAATVGRESNR